MRTRAFVLAALLLSCLVSCSDDPQPKIADPTETPSSTSAAPTVSTDPTSPSPSDPQQAFRDFIDGYIGAISTSLSTGDPDPWLAMSDARCGNCQVFANNLRAAYAEGGRIEGGNWTVQKAVHKEDTELGSVWFVDVDSDRERWLDGQGHVVKVVEAGINFYGFAISTDGGHLLIREFRFRDA